MSRGHFPQLALATRRQTAQLSHHTYTVERRNLFELVLRLSFDLGRVEAPVPSAAWVARTLTLHKADVSRAEKALVRFGMIKVREANTDEGKRRFYKPEPDVSGWCGEGFAWRIADAQARALAIMAECQLATCEAHEDSPQGTLPLEFVPTVSEEFTLGFEEAKADAAIDAAGTMPAAVPSSAAPSTAPQFSGHCPENPPGPTIIETGLSAAVRRTLYPKDRLAVEGSVGRAANEVPTAASSAPATRPSQGGKSLARQPTPPGDRWPSGQRSGPASGGKTLAARPTVEGNGAPSAPPGDDGVGRTANDPGPAGGKTLAAQPTIPPASCAGARMSGTFSIHHSEEIHLPSTIAADGAAARSSMENVAGAAGGRNGPERASDELLRRVFEVVRTGGDFRVIQHWRRLLAPKVMQALAVDLLGEIKLRADDSQQGRGTPIRNPGGWFVHEFYKRAGIPRPAHKAKS